VTLVAEVREARDRPRGALVLLHGRGADEHDLYPLLDVFDPEAQRAGLTPGGPLSLPPGGRHWYAVPRVGFPDRDTFAVSYAALQAFVDAWLAERAIAWADTVIGGFSQGAVMAYALGLGPGRPVPAGILAMSGFVPTVEGWEPSLGDRADLPVAIVHGAGDPVISVEFARDAHERLGAAGLAVDYAEHPGAHHIDPRDVPRLTAWVAQRAPQQED
jgi:phospholipase/carboxylesterase